MSVLYIFGIVHVQIGVVGGVEIFKIEFHWSVLCCDCCGKIDEIALICKHLRTQCNWNLSTLSIKSIENDSAALLKMEKNYDK